MKKLDIKHLAPYLPYGLKFLDTTDNEVFTLNALYDNGDALSWDLGETSTDIIKPLLRPLTDLTKTIEHNGKEFVPTVFFYQPLNVSPSEKSYIVDELKFLASVNHFPEDTVLFHFVVQKLFEWHFDVFNLIRDGLAVNINKIKQDK